MIVLGINRSNAGKACCLLETEMTFEGIMENLIFLDENSFRLLGAKNECGIETRIFETEKILKERKWKAGRSLDLNQTLTFYKEEHGYGYMIHVTGLVEILEKNPMPGNSQFMGEVGKAWKFSVKKLYLAKKRGRYNLYVMEDTDGNVYTCMTRQVFRMPLSGRIAIRGIIKDHVVYRGIRQTWLEHPDIIWY